MENQQQRPPCAVCQKPATRVIPIVVQVTVRQASPIHVANSEPTKAIETAVNVPLCAECNPATVRAGAAMPVPICEPPRVQLATPGDVARLAP